MTEAEAIVRAAWTGPGDPPPLIVSREQYADFLAAGLPAERMKIAETMPEAAP